MNMSTGVRIRAARRNCEVATEPHRMGAVLKGAAHGYAGQRWDPQVARREHACHGNSLLSVPPSEPKSAVIKKTPTNAAIAMPTEGAMPTRKSKVADMRIIK